MFEDSDETTQTVTQDQIEKFSQSVLVAVYVFVSRITKMTEQIFQKLCSCSSLLTVNV